MFTTVKEMLKNLKNKTFYSLTGLNLRNVTFFNILSSINLHHFYSFLRIYRCIKNYLTTQNFNV